MYNGNVRDLSAHTRFVNEQSEGPFTPIVTIETIDYNYLLLEEAREQLSFIDDEAYHRLLDFFDDSFYNTSTKGVRFNQKGVTIRMASSYNINSNRVYRNWNCSIEDVDTSVRFVPPISEL